jgi:hypothetical protein
MYSILINNVGKVYETTSLDEAKAKYQEIQADLEKPTSSYFGYDVFLMQNGQNIFRQGGKLEASNTTKKPKFQNEDIVSFKSKPFQYFIIVQALRKGDNIEYKLMDITSGVTKKIPAPESELELATSQLDAKLKSKTSDFEKVKKINDVIMLKIGALSNKDVLQDRRKQDKYVKLLQQMLKVHNINMLNPKIHDKLEEQNYFLLNQALAFGGNFGENMFQEYMREYDSNAKFKSEYLNPYPLIISQKNKYYKKLEGIKKMEKSLSKSSKMRNKIGMMETATLKAIQNVDKFRKGGELSKEFMFDTNFIVYVPSTTDVGTKISEKELEGRVDLVKNYFAELFGGFTETEADGGYKSNDGRIITEDIVKVSVFATSDDWENKEQEVVDKIKSWAKEWGQESIGFEYEGDLYYIDEVSKKKSPIKMALGGDIKIEENNTHNTWNTSNPMIRSNYGIGGRIIHN